MPPTNAPTKANPACLPLRHPFLIVPGMSLASGVGVVFPLPAVVCTIGEGIGALVIATGAVVVVELGDPVTLAVGVPGGKIIVGRFGKPLHMF